MNVAQGTLKCITSLFRFQMERKIFEELLELKRLQIRAGRANEQLMVKRLSDSYAKTVQSLAGLRNYDGPFTFKEFEKYLYSELFNESLVVCFRLFADRSTSADCCLLFSCCLLAQWWIGFCMIYFWCFWCAFVTRWVSGQLRSTQYGRRPRSMPGLLPSSARNFSREVQVMIDSKSRKSYKSKEKCCCWAWLFTGV